MKIVFFVIIFLLQFFCSKAQQTPFEKSNGKQSATYFEAIEFYKKADQFSPKILMKEIDSTDSYYPLHIVLISDDEKFDPVAWHKQNKAVILINNGIHAGEPDGIDATMLLVKDLMSKKTALPKNVVLAIIPVYNIGGALNRHTSSRVNQNGPEEYGFRGNSQNLDLNRDFIKCDSKEAKAFAKIFHYLDPDILLDNHVSDGANFQHTATLITTQYDKLGSITGQWLKNIFEPKLYKSMREKGWDMLPYVYASEEADLTKGWRQFYDSPMYSSGYAALFQTIGFMPETHMLKPFDKRVASAKALMETLIQETSLHATKLKTLKKQDRTSVINREKFPLKWQLDSTQKSMITFKGYTQDFKTSDATGFKRMYFDQTKPFTKQVPYYNAYKPLAFVTKPKAYLIPHGWQNVVDLLKLNKVAVQQFNYDTLIEVEAYHIEAYKSLQNPYEKHHKNYDIKVSLSKQKIKFLKGDYIILMNQTTNRYVIEMLEPAGDDSFFAWNFFDAILQQKEGYSDYRWEDVAADVLNKDPDLKKRLETKKLSDSGFAANASAQLDFIYKNSKYYEPAHLQYPVYRLPAK